MTTYKTDDEATLELHEYCNTFSGSEIGDRNVVVSLKEMMYSQRHADLLAFREKVEACKVTLREKEDHLPNAYIHLKAKNEMADMLLSWIDTLGK